LSSPLALLLSSPLSSSLSSPFSSWKTVPTDRFLIPVKASQVTPLEHVSHSPLAAVGVIEPQQHPVTAV
jgi:hypothetical protein